MGINFKTFGGLLALLVSGVAFPAVVVAETETPNYETTNDTFERAFFQNDRNFYENSTPKRQLESLMGSGSVFRNSFPENEIARDAELLNTLYRDVMKQQVSNDPYLRTPDLPNPYDTSLLMSPRLNAEKLRVGTEFRFESMK
ncbi:hypothetical protein PN465_03560 [Nodularia spumigena CS-584]|jgi:hypothetical protein|uniref:Uncharacterized protein n=1 Tax=Nodularia spumigena UHCC 0060 TaxID=3110300 RepID=A0ABU5UR07_NODSP|nr:hypothetical protein [Nodularia spumigena]AHJ28882.1 hypothetical protein NSP_25540 [Nodularia spumigena CCY9414]EAW45127.1 hypothetical protein N9414_16876 [Nodularia spumigena CCY9414]MDB9346841.1 hypothetical protein [Nodularia spumigena CS-588/01]MDB9352824.1 hypothetical protein [Nodularia spumigena CS-588/05]MDB9381319.1 hypothetical protein [Nodularia spumigena CS-584]